MPHKIAIMLIIRSTKQPSRPEFSQLCRRPSMSAAWSKSAIRFESLGRQTAGFGVSLRQWGLTGGSSHTFSTIQEASCWHPVGRSIQKCVLGHTNNPGLHFSSSSHRLDSSKAASFADFAGFRCSLHTAFVS